MRDSFVFYRSFAEAINKLDQDNRLNVYDALCRYALDGEIVTDNGIVKAMLTLMIPQIDANNRRYENGKKGGRNKNQSETKPEPNHNQTITKMEPKETKPEPNVNVNVNVNDNVNDNDIKDKRKRFTPPTLEEVKSYCQERKNSVDPERFINFYESKGWVVGKSPMKDWKAAVRNWEKDSKVVTTNKFKNFDERSYDMDTLEEELVAKSMSKGN